MFLLLNKHQVQEQVWGRSLGTFMHNTLVISHNTCTTSNEPECKRPRRIGASKVWTTDTTTIRSSSRRFAHSNPHSPQPMSLNGSHCLVIKIELKVSSGSVLLNDWLAYLLFFAKLELVNHILGNP